MIKKHGYPNCKAVGKEAMKKFWLLIQHQDMDLDLQEKCLKYCDFEKPEKALLTDRILVAKNKKQIYGTQFFRQEDGSLKPRPIKDEKNLDKLRKSTGFEPFAEYQKKMQGIERETKKIYRKQQT